MTPLLNILLILFCLGFIWGMTLKHRVNWLLCAIMGGIIIMFAPITVPLALIMYKEGK